MFCCQRLWYFHGLLHNHGFGCSAAGDGSCSLNNVTKQRISVRSLSQGGTGRRGAESDEEASSGQVKRLLDVVIVILRKKEEESLNPGGRGCGFCLERVLEGSVNACGYACCRLNCRPQLIEPNNKTHMIRMLSLPGSCYCGPRSS